MALDDYDTTLGIWTELEPSFDVLRSHLAELGFEEADEDEFRIFCTPADAVEYFKYPKKTHWNHVKIEVVTAYPRHMCSIVRSTEYIK